ncbi:MAG: GNAT family N-acetyltransferase [Rhodanobacteraceae bacterium]
MQKTARPKRPTSPGSAYRSATRPPRRAESARTRANEAELPGASEPFTTADGRALVLRPIRSGDAEALRRAFSRLTPEQVRLRLFHRMNELSEEAAERMTHVDPATTIAYVVVDADNEVRAEARVHIDPVTEAAEFAIAVDPEFTHQGIGRRLLQRLIADSRRRGLYELWGDVLAENQAMLDFAKVLGAERHSRADEPGLTRVSFQLR